MGDQRESEEARRSYWTAQMDAATGFMVEVFSCPVEECGEPLVSLSEAVDGETVDVVFSSTPFAERHGRLLYLREGLVEDFVGVARPATTNSILVSNGPASSSVALYMAVGPSMISLGGGLHILLGVGLTGPFGLPTNASGVATIPVSIPNDSALKGLSVFLQAAGTDTTGFTLSNGVEIRICK